MEDIPLSHAKAHLEELLERAARGEDLRIVDARIGAVKLVVAEMPAKAYRRTKHLGLLEGKIPPPPIDFFEPMSEDELKLWYGEAE